MTERKKKNNEAEMSTQATLWGAWVIMQIVHMDHRECFQTDCTEFLCIIQEVKLK